MTTIIGIDFSGAKSDRNTWVARGRIGPDGALTLERAESTRRMEVIELLGATTAPTVVGLDFPFGVPRAFAETLNADDLETMPDVWEAVSNLSLSDFIERRDAFVVRCGEHKRCGDEKHFKESFSPLHKANPNMLPMTYYGIRMLRELHERCATSWTVPPMPTRNAGGRDTVTLLETMPGAFLKAVGFEYTVYKRYKKARDALNNRRHILDALSQRSGVRLPNLSEFREDCLASDDCLDSIIAAVSAASWALDSARFRHPEPSELAAAELEGWIYVPQSAE